METALTECGLRTTHVDEFAADSQSRLGETRPRAYGFTLVELLVVITIISILAALITVAAIGALKKAREAQVRTEINEIATAVDDYKNKTTAYPPNCQNDAGGPLDDLGILLDVKRHIKQLAPRTQEVDDLAQALTDQLASKTIVSRSLAGGLTASEAVVFWLGGFSSDPKYPISGEGGPSYSITSKGAATNRTLDPIESRKWIFPFDVTRLGPRAADGFFDETNGRFIEFTDAKGKFRRINFWVYTPPKSTQPYLYFDTSRHPAGVLSGSNITGPYDPPAATSTSPTPLNVYAFKKVNASYSTTNSTTTPCITFVNPDKYQILHCGLDGVWDNDNFDSFKKMTAGTGVTNQTSNFLLFPTGPFVGEVADTIVNFAPETRIEDAQK